MATTHFRYSSAIHIVERQLLDGQISDVKATRTELQHLFDEFDAAYVVYFDILDNVPHIEAAEVYFDDACAILLSVFIALDKYVVSPSSTLKEDHTEGQVTSPLQQTLDILHVELYDIYGNVLLDLHVESSLYPVDVVLTDVHLNSELTELTQINCSPNTVQHDQLPDVSRITCVTAQNVPGTQVHVIPHPVDLNSSEDHHAIIVPLYVRCDTEVDPVIVDTPVISQRFNLPHHTTTVSADNTGSHYVKHKLRPLSTASHVLTSLSLVSVYDPLGLFVPVYLPSDLLFQQASCYELLWNDIPPDYFITLSSTS